jgi:hypothetical protein
VLTDGSEVVVDRGLDVAERLIADGRTSVRETCAPVPVPDFDGEALAEVNAVPGLAF